MSKVVVTDSTFPALDRERAVAAKYGLTLSTFQCKSSQEVAEAVKGAKAVFVQFAPLHMESIVGLAPQATIVRYGVGYDNVDFGSALAAGHRVCYVPDYCTDEVADHTAALILAGLRKLPQLDASIRVYDWKAVAVSRPLKPFDSTTVGFIGLGRIGRALLHRIRNFGFDLAVSDPSMTEVQAAELGVRKVSTEEIIESADVVTLHVPATPQTRGMINASSLATMQPGALIVNCSRGDLIDETALAEALFKGRVRAALDVFHEEPLPISSPLRTAPNLILTPHAAWYSDRAMDRLQQLACDEVDRGLSGRPARCPVPVLTEPFKPPTQGNCVIPTTKETIR